MVSLSKHKSTHAVISFSKGLDRKFFGWKQKSLVGIVSPSYGTEKVSYGLSPENFKYRKLFRVPVQRLESAGSFWKTTPIVLDHPVELVHTFNEIPIGIRPFVVSFENELPRYLGDPARWQINAGIDMLSSDRCRAIMALSEVAAINLRSKFLRLGVSEIASKISVFRGAVLDLPLNNSMARQRTSSLEPLRVLFVGRDAFGKGLLPTLDALDQCRSEGALIQATLVCNFEERDYISKGRLVDRLGIVERIRQQPDTTYYPLVTNQKIQEMMRSHDVLIFPTLDESLGWVAVEASLAGMPVISTDVYALPEIVIHGVTGYLIRLNKAQDSSRWSGLWLEGGEFDREVACAFESMKTDLSSYLMNFFVNPQLSSEMGQAAREHVSSMYSFELARAKLKNIYKNALG